MKRQEITNAIAAAMERAQARIKANNGDAQSLYEIGTAYLHGNHVKQNYFKAFEIFCYAAEKGHTLAIKEIENIKRQGLLETNPKEGCKDAWFWEEAEKGHSHALFILADIHAKGEDVKRDLPKALEYAIRFLDAKEDPEIKDLDYVMQIGLLNKWLAPESGKVSPGAVL